MKTRKNPLECGFTLLETVIAIGVLAVLLTGFMIVFAPAAAGIRKSINVQEADRMASTLERELVTLRKGESSAQIPTGFDKAFRMIEDSMNTASPEVVFVYQYRGMIDSPRTEDGTPKPYTNADGVPGQDYSLVPMARRRVDLEGAEDPLFEEDLDAVEGSVIAVRAKQLIFNGGELVVSTKQVIEDPSPGTDPAEPPSSGQAVSKDYPEAVIAFSAEFYGLQSKAYSYLKTGGKFDPSELKNPVFTRNLAVRR